MLDDVAGAKQWHGLVDWYHAMEHINAAAQLLEEEPQEQQRRRAELERTLKRNSKGAAWVHAQLHAASLQHSGRSRKGTELSRHAGYFIDERRMNYRRHLHRRWPIGSGALEGACKSLICARTKRSGQRWHNEGLKRVLALRGLERSDRLAPLWRRVCERHRPPVTIASRN